MSRIPYTNKVGETVGSIADPAAAYSLRALNGGDPMVARVRRSSDDAEKDFTASDMNSGSVADWVNGKQDTTLPCDVASAAAAYSLRSVNSNYAGSVVRVRRSSDNVEQDFTDVSLIASWVGSGNNGHVTTWYDQSGNGNNATQSTASSQPKIVDAGVLVSDGIKFDGSDDMLQTGTTVIDQTNAGTISHFGVVNVASGEAGYLWGSVTPLGTLGTSLYATDNSKFTLANGTNVLMDTIIRGGGEELVSACYSSDSANLRVNGGGTQTSVGGYNFTVNDEFTIGNREAGAASATFLNGSISEIIVFNSDQSSNRFKIESNINNHYDLYTNANDGHVTTWYDQSGNDNHATQGTAGSQPKIVDGGVLVSDGIDFNGAEYLSRSSFTQGDLEQPNTIFSVAKMDSNDDTNRKVYDGKTGDGRNMLFLSPTGSGQFGIYSGIALLTGDTATSDKHLFTALYNSTSSELFIDGTSEASGNAGDYSMDAIVIGANHDKASNRWLGTIQEIIIYNSDQSFNRFRIESNINNHYDIY